VIVSTKDIGMKNLPNVIRDMAYGRDGYVGLSAEHEQRAIGCIMAKAGAVGSIAKVAVEEDDYGTYNAAVTFCGVVNEEDIAHRLCLVLNHKGNRLTEWLPDSDDLVVHISGIRADKLGI
jgi:hypothetical protein